MWGSADRAWPEVLGVGSDPEGTTAPHGVFWAPFPSHGQAGDGKQPWQSRS